MKKEPFPVLLYDHDFSLDMENAYPPSLRCFAMSPHSDHLGMVQNGYFALSFEGNWHCLHAKDLSDFRLEMTLEPNYNNVPAFLLYFRAETQTPSALYLELRQDHLLKFGVLNGTHYDVKECAAIENPSCGLWSVTLLKGKVTVCCKGKELASFTIPGDSPAKGLIALDASFHAFGANEGRISRLKLFVPEKCVKTLPTLRIPMKYGPHGIVSDYTFILERTALYGCEKWSLTLEGGPGKAEDFPEPRCMNAEIMDNAYCRALDKAGKELFRILIAKGRAGSFTILRATYGLPEHIFPLSRKNVPVESKDIALLAFGYEYYESEAANSLAGGPAEVVCDLEGNPLSFRKLYPDGKYELLLESPEDKAIVKMIPEDIPEYNEALQYARRNHYFLEGERVRFRGVCTPLEATDGVFTLEDAWKNTLRTFKRKANAFFDLGKLPPGVYHLSAVLKRNNLVLGSVRNAFEVIPADPELSAQKIAGYPDIYPDTFLQDNSHHFHPWGEALCDVSHYVGTGNQYTYCIDWRRLKLLKLYHREWTSRCQPGYASKENVEYIKKHASLIQVGMGPGRYYLHMPDTYENPWMKEQIRAFAGKDLSFEEIYPERWSQWLDFIAPRCREQYKEHNTLRKGARAAEYLTAATYGCIYKGPNYTRLMGVDLRNGRFGEILTGFSVMEDYPYSSRYPLSRCTYQYTALTMEGPDVRHLPQVWGLNAETLDSRVVYGHPPFGISVTPPKFFHTRIMELLYATAYFNGKEFAYWQGNGLMQSSAWTGEMFSEMVKLFHTYKVVKPVAPLRSPAYVYSRAACDAHEYFYEKNERFIRGGSMVNTAEEFAAYLYEMARKDGQAPGFLTRMESLKGLKPSRVSLLILPPLKGVPEAELKEVRRLHKGGVNLLCSEDAASLADLFDVENAAVVLERNGKKILTLKKNGKAQAAFFTIAPSMQQRAKDRTGGSGQKALDAEINKASMEILRLLGDYPVTATNKAAVTPFLGSDGHTYTFVQENSWPDHGGRIQTDVLFNGKVVCSVDLDLHESKLIRLD